MVFYEPKAKSLSRRHSNQTSICSMEVESKQIDSKKFKHCKFCKQPLTDFVILSPAVDKLR